MPGTSQSSGKSTSAKSAKRKRRSEKSKKKKHEVSHTARSESVGRGATAVAGHTLSPRSDPQAVMRTADRSESERGSTEVSYGNEDFESAPLETRIVDRSETRADVEAELRVSIGPAVAGETMQPKSMDDDRQPFLKDYKWLFLAGICFLVVVAAIVVGVVLGLQEDDEPTITQVFTPATPQCEFANTLIAPNIAVRGSTFNATEAALCGEENFAGKSVITSCFFFVICHF
ncbi:MAG: hypothetical protein SGARI_003868 [Bacillariaceae sp.]